MTEPPIERLLQQMSLQHPSEALERRIADCLQSTPDSPLPATSAVRSSWAVMVVVAVASLLVGVMLGRGFPGPTAVAQRWSAGPSDASRNTPAASTTGAITASVAKVNWLKDVQAPNVLFVCAAGVPAVDEPAASLECVACHTGLPQARSEFLTRHRAYAGFSTCQVCHTSDVEDL